MESTLLPAAYIQISLYLGLVAALVLTWPTGAVIHRRYRRAVHRMMRSGGPALEQAPSPAQPLLPPPPLRVGVMDTATQGAGAAKTGVAARAREGRRRWGMVSAGAGICHAAASTAYIAWTEGFTLAPQIAVVFYACLWPVVFITARVLGARWHALAGMAAAYLLGAQLLGPTLAYAVYAYLLFGAGLATVMLLAASSRRLGSIGPLLFGSWTVGAITAMVGLQGIGTVLIEHTIPGPGAFLAVNVAALALAAVAAWAVLRVMGRRYEAGGTSGEMLALDAQWLVVTVAQAGLTLSTAGARELGTVGALGWYAAGMLPFAVYLAARHALAALPRRHPPATPVPLLLLRTFGARRRSERLMEELGAQWRFVGPIDMIAGEDLATANLEPHELFDFLSGRLGGRFVNRVEQAPVFAARMNRERDRDGRYRVNELFCRDGTWKAALQAVLAQPRPVLLDLRGFTEHNRGCVYELSYLADHLPLRNLVLVVDETTARPALDQALRQAWAQMAAGSPNRAEPHAELRIVDLGEGRPDALAVLRRALFQAAAPEPPAVPARPAPAAAPV